MINMPQLLLDARYSICLFYHTLSTVLLDWNKIF